jgi:Protein of unknown function (DUF2716)
MKRSASSRRPCQARATVDLLRAARDFFARRRGEPPSLESREAQFLRELEEDTGPLGREGTVWGHGPGVHAEDQEAWEWLAEDAPPELEAWSDGIQSQLPRLPHGSVLYDLDAGLELGELHVRDPLIQARVKELNRDVLGAFQRATRPDEWIYAIDEPEAGYYYCYRFWPHHASDETKWYVSPVPDGDHEFFASSDFSWGLLALFGGFPSGEWQVCAFGERLLGALSQDPPRALSVPLEGDAFSQGDAEERALEHKTALLMLKLGLNCQLARDHGLWSRDLERRYAKIDKSSPEDHVDLEVVAGLIARVEIALAEAGVEFEPAMSHFHE